MSRNSKDQLAGCLGDPNANTVEVGDGFFFLHAWWEAECFQLLDFGVYKWCISKIYTP